MDLAEEVVVLDVGRKLTEDPPEAIRGDGRMARAYVGGAVC